MDIRNNEYKKQWIKETMDIRKRDSVLALLTCPHYHHWTYNAWKVQMEDKAE